MGWRGKWNDCIGQTYVRDYDGNDRFYEVSDTGRIIAWSRTDNGWFEFCSGHGPLKTTLDVTSAAQKISEAGTKLDKLTRRIADQCAESSTKNDLLAYLLRIALYCHQLNITSKVIADVQNIRGELIESGVSERNIKLISWLSTESNHWFCFLAG